MLYKAEGIITRISSMNEADKLVNIYSREHGLIRAVAKGCRRTKSKLAGRIDLFCRNNFILGRGKNLDIINQADIINNYYEIHKTLDKIHTASYIAKVINRVTLPSLKSHELFNLLSEILKLIAEHDDYEKIKKLFQNKFLELEGLSNERDINSDEEFEKILYNIL